MAQYNFGLSGNRLANALPVIAAMFLAACNNSNPEASHSQQIIPQSTQETKTVNGNTARPGDIAIRQEYDTAVASSGREKLELFLARHPDHPLAVEAERELAKRS